jgi:energy-coupling factor transporter ATP-binding protein EcfA2
VRDLTLTLDGRTLASGLDFDLGPGERLLITADRGEALTAVALALGGLVPSPWREAVGASDWSRDWTEFEHRVLAARLTAAELTLPARTLVVPEDLDPWFTAGTGHDELSFFGWTEGCDAALDAAVFGLFDRQLLSRPIYNLSGGEKQRLALTEALVCRPDCLILLNGLGWLDREHRPAALDALALLDAPLIFCDDHVELLADRCSHRIHLDPAGAAHEAVRRSPRRPPAAEPAGAARPTPGLPGDPIITANRLTFLHTGFTDVSVLRDATFAIPPARDVFLVGANGTGKSTLASLVCGLESPHRGRLQVRDPRAGRMEPRALRARLGAAGPQMLFQFVDDNLIRPDVDTFLALGIGREEVERRPDVIAWLAAAGVQRDAVVTGLDAFQKKLIVLARMAVTHCRLAFFDEPAWGLTGVERGQLYGFVDAFLGDMTRIWITHEPDSVPYRPEAIATIADGRVMVE